MQHTDAELVRQVLAGDTAAFGPLVRRHQGAVYGLAYSQVGSFADAQDIAQEAFIHAFRNLRQLDQPERFAAWLHAITRNECRMLQRQCRRLGATRFRLCEGDTAADVWERYERQAAVEQALRKLPETGRLVLALHYLSGCSCPEIADLLELPVQAIESRLYRARRRLREELLTMTEETLTAQRLPEDFADQVLRELSLTPDGFVTTLHISPDRRTLLMEAAQSGWTSTLVALTMRASDQAAILSGPFDPDEALPKGHGVACAQQVMQAFGITLQQIVLRLEGETQCRARAMLRKGRTTRTLDLRASDALALAARLHAPIYAEDALVRQGKVGEDGLACDVEGSLEELRAHLRTCHQRTHIEHRLFDLGLSPEEGRDTGRYRRNEAAGSLQMEVVGSDGDPLALSLEEHRSAVEQLWQVAGRGETGLWHHSGRTYETRYELEDDAVLVHYAVQAPDTPPDQSTEQTR